MAAGATDSKEKPAANGYDQQPTPQPPYYVTTGPTSMQFGGPGSDPICFQQASFGTQAPMLYPNQAPAVMVTQPVAVVSGDVPKTTCALVMSTLSVIFCMFWCGAAGILLAWKAKLLVLEKKYEHARHTLRIAWLFFSMAVLFGAAVWIVVGVYLYFITSYYRRNSYY